jgi:hypothetical protein
MFAQISIVALVAGLAAAQHAPVGNPSGNPISRPLTEVCIPAPMRAMVVCCDNNHWNSP